MKKFSLVILTLGLIFTCVACKQTPPKQELDLANIKDLIGMTKDDIESEYSVEYMYENQLVDPTQTLADTITERDLNLGIDYLFDYTVDLAFDDNSQYSNLTKVSYVAEIKSEDINGLKKLALNVYNTLKQDKKEIVVPADGNYLYTLENDPLDTFTNEIFDYYCSDGREKYNAFFDEQDGFYFSIGISGYMSTENDGNHSVIIRLNYQKDLYEDIKAEEIVPIETYFENN